MLHLLQQTSRYNKSVVQSRYKRSTKLIIRKLNTLEPRPGTYNTDKTHINYLGCLVLKQTKLNPTQEIQIIYYTIPVNFLLTLFCLFVHSRESQNIKKPWQCKIFDSQAVQYVLFVLRFNLWLKGRPSQLQKTLPCIRAAQLILKKLKSRFKTHMILLPKFTVARVTRNRHLSIEMKGIIALSLVV